MMTFSKLRKARNLTQVEMAKLLGIAQENVSRIEHRSDMLISTMRSYVRAMGGDLTVVSELGQGAEFTLTLPIGATVPLELQR